MKAKSGKGKTKIRRNKRKKKGEGVIKWRISSPDSNIWAQPNWGIDAFTS